jgi:Zn-finger nucleic acid-binding protein
MIKNCPLCKIGLTHTRLAEDLPAYQCQQCGGMWLSADEYLAWRVNYPYVSAEALDIEQEFEVPYLIADNNQPLFCPDCGRFLRRFEIWPNITFHLDRCSTCNGIWFDQHEWETLQEQHLHYHLNVFFSAEWQAKMKNEAMRQRFVELYRNAFGKEDYAKVQELRAWFQVHPQGHRLLAYVMDKDPYKG